MSRLGYVRVVELGPEELMRASQQEVKQQAIEEYDLELGLQFPSNVSSIPESLLTSAERKIRESLQAVLRDEAKMFLADKPDNIYYSRTLRLFSANQKNPYRTTTSLGFWHNKLEMRKHVGLIDRSQPTGRVNPFGVQHIGRIGDSEVHEVLSKLPLQDWPQHVIEAPETIFDGCVLSLKPITYESCYTNPECRRSGCGHLRPFASDCNSMSCCEIQLDLTVPVSDRKKLWIPEWLLVLFGCHRV